MAPGTSGVATRRRAPEFQRHRLRALPSRSGPEAPQHFTADEDLKRLNATNGLAGYRTLHFATHGLLAGETETLGSGAEPALLLTPPSTASEADDGLLTASEVAQLKLDAEWVVLSACNTASADKGGGEALSGLARAFFYAGARALLVSHWYVDSDAAVKLVTSAFSALQRDPAIGRGRSHAPRGAHGHGRPVACRPLGVCRASFRLGTFCRRRRGRLGAIVRN